MGARAAGIEAGAIRNQGGAALVVALLVLTVLTLLVLAALRGSATDLLVTHNLEERARVASSVQIGLDRLLNQSSAAAFVAGSEQTFDDLDPEVTVAEPRCVGSSPASGYSARTSVTVPEDTVWEMTGSAQDPVSGADTTLTEGVRIRLHNGVCSDHP